MTRLAARTDTDLASTIQDGLPNRGMPPVKMSEAEQTVLIQYLRTMRPPRRGELAAAKVTVELKNGRKLTGLAVNQSYQDLQLRTPDNRLHLLRRAGPSSVRSRPRRMGQLRRGDIGKPLQSAQADR